MEPGGHFTMKEAILTIIEASIYESRIGTAETSVYSLVFDNGVSLKVKTSFTVNLEQIIVKGEDEEGRIILTVDGYGDLQTFGEKQDVLFKSQWKVVEEPQIILYNNLITELKIPIVYSGAGVNGYKGNFISGQMLLNLTGFDESGTGVYEIQGEGTIQSANL